MDRSGGKISGRSLTTSADQSSFLAAKWGSCSSGGTRKTSLRGAGKWSSTTIGKTNLERVIVNPGRPPVPSTEHAYLAVSPHDPQPVDMWSIKGAQHGKPGE